MCNQNTETMEDIGQAARRLLQELDARTKNASGRIKTARKIHETRGQSPAAPVAGETKQPGGSGAKSHPRPRPVALGLGSGRDEFLIAANENGTGRVDRGFRPVETDVRMRRPASDADSNSYGFTVRESNVRRDEF